MSSQKFSCSLRPQASSRWLPTGECRPSSPAGVVTGNNNLSISELNVLESLITSLFLLSCDRFHQIGKKITNMNLYDCFKHDIMHNLSVPPEMKRSREFVWILFTRFLPSWPQFSFRSSSALWKHSSLILRQCAERGCMTFSCGSRTTTGTESWLWFVQIRFLMPSLRDVTMFLQSFIT